MRLALALGKTQTQLLNEMDSVELSRWVAYDKLHPLPDPYWIAGLICEVLAHCLGGAKGKFDPYKWVPGAKPKLSEASLKAKIKGLFGG